MIISRICQKSRILLSPAAKMLFSNSNDIVISRFTHFRSGALKPKPEEMPFSLLAVFCSVVPGLLVGAAISKSIANFLEENDLFVPSDDDDDDDD